VSAIGEAGMTIKKQEFYEGAALHLLARGGRITSLRYEAPYFLFNGTLRVLFKYSTKNRSPWGFTFAPEECAMLRQGSPKAKTVIGLICGGDGVAAISSNSFLNVTAGKNGAIHIACYRNHGEHYEVSGPSGTIKGKVAPSTWQNILDE